MRFRRAGIVLAFAVVLGVSVTVVARSEGIVSWYQTVLGLEPPVVDLRGLPMVDGEARQVWSVRIPWSKDGLGGADEYLGGDPIAGPFQGALPPDRICVGPGPLIAVGQYGFTLVYDVQGNLLWRCSGSPVGFLWDGSLVTGGLHLYSPSGELLWTRNPCEIIAKELGLEDKLKERLLGFSGDYYTSGWDIYYDTFVRVYRKVIGQTELGVGTVIETIDSFNVCLVLGRDGEVKLCKKHSAPTVFSPWGTAFGTYEKDGEMKGKQEVDLSRYPWRTKRVLLLDKGVGIEKVGADGSLLVCSGRATEDPTVYYCLKPGAGYGVRFTMPYRAWLNRYTLLGGQLLVTETLERDALYLTCWEWPSPK